MELDWNSLGVENSEFAEYKNPFLIVEDSFATLQVVYKMLVSIGISNIRSARSTQDAYNILVAENISLALIDIELGEVSGVQLLRGMRSVARLKSVPAVMMTASRTHRYLAEAKYLGASGYLLKPFKRENLYQKISKALADAAYEAAHAEVKTALSGSWTKTRGKRT